MMGVIWTVLQSVLTYPYVGYFGTYRKHHFR
jgi:hypothetical protein